MALTLVTSDLIVGLDYSKLSGTVTTWNQNTTGSAATLTTARNIGGVSFNGSVAINLPGVNTAGNQNTSGTAAGLSATLVVGSGGTGVTSITALKNVLDDETWTFANHITATGTLTVNGTGNSAFSGDLYIVGKKLDISAPSGGNAYVKFSDTNSGAKIWRVGTSLSSRGVFNIYNQTDDSFPFNVLANGNVGIGTTAPHTLGSSNLSSHMNLQVHSSSSTAAHIISSGGVNGSVMLEHRNASANSKIWRLMSSGGTFSVNALNDNTGVKTSALSISSGGNVGIGISPSHKLDVSGTIHQGDGTADTYFGLGSNNDNYISTNGGTTRFRNGGTVQLTITSGGELISTKGIEFQGTSLGSGQTGVASSGSGGDLRFYTNGTQSVTIKSDGKVGIGTASPGGKLHIVSSGGTDGLRLNAGTSASNFAIIANNQADNATLFYVKGDGAAHFSGNTSANVVTARDNMFVGAGQFYIGAVNGSTNDTYRQEVSSGIFKIKSRKSGTWADKLHITSGGVLQIFGTSTANALSIAHDSGNNVTMSTPFLNTSQDLKMINSSAGVLLDYAATSWTSNSDENIKENIISLNHVLDKIKDIRCVNYNLKDETIYKKRLGFIAQDFQEDFAEVVNENSEGILGLRYTETIPILMKAIQEQQAQIELLKKEVELLKQ